MAESAMCPALTSGATCWICPSCGRVGKTRTGAASRAGGTSRAVRGPEAAAGDAVPGRSTAVATGKVVRTGPVPATIATSVTNASPTTAATDRVPPAVRRRGNNHSGLEKQDEEREPAIKTPHPGEPAADDSPHYPAQPPESTGSTCVPGVTI